MKVSANTWPATDQHTSYEGVLYGLSRTPQHFHLQRLHPGNWLTEDAGLRNGVRVYVAINLSRLASCKAGTKGRGWKGERTTSVERGI